MWLFVVRIQLFIVCSTDFPFWMIRGYLRVWLAEQPCWSFQRVDDLMTLTGSDLTCVTCSGGSRSLWKPLKELWGKSGRPTCEPEESGRRLQLCSQLLQRVDWLYCVQLGEAEWPHVSCKASKTDLGWVQEGSLLRDLKCQRWWEQLQTSINGLLQFKSLICSWMNRAVALSEAEPSRTERFPAATSVHNEGKH